MTQKEIEELEGRDKNIPTVGSEAQPAEQEQTEIQIPSGPIGDRMIEEDPNRPRDKRSPIEKKKGDMGFETPDGVAPQEIDSNELRRLAGMEEREQKIQKNIDQRNLGFREAYGGRLNGSYQGDFYFQDEDGKNKKAYAGTDANGNTYYRLPNGAGYYVIDKEGKEVGTKNEQEYDNALYGDLTAIERNRRRKADAAQQRYNNLFLDGKQHSEQEIEAELGNDTWAYQTVYGGGKGRLGTALGAGALWGKVNNDTLDTLERRRLDELSRGQKAGELAQKAMGGYDEYGNPISGGIIGKIKDDNGNEIPVRDSFRSQLVEWNNKYGSDKANLSPEAVAEMNQILNNNGFDLDISNADNATDIASLLNNAVEQNPMVDEALSMAGVNIDSNGNVFMPKEMSFEDIVAERQKEREAQRMRADQRSIERRRARLGFADLAASLGDIMKGSQGAPVHPRDLAAMYKNLDAQSQRLYDQALAREEADKERQAAQNATLLKYQHDMNKLALTLGDKEKARNKKHESDIDLQKEKNKGKLAVAKAKGKSGGTEKMEGVIFIGDKAYGASKSSGMGSQHAGPRAIHGSIDKYINSSENEGLKKLWRQSTVKTGGVISEENAQATINEFFSSLKESGIASQEIWDDLENCVKQVYPSYVNISNEPEEGNEGDGGMFD